METLFQDALAIVPAWQPEVAHEKRDGQASLLPILERAHLDAVAEAPGVPPQLAIDAAVWAAHVLHWSCWMLLNRLASTVVLPAELSTKAPVGESPDEHWSVDLSFRFMFSVVGQCRRLAQRDQLLATLSELLQAWPLSAIGTEATPNPSRLEIVLAHPSLRLIFRDRLLQRRELELAQDPRIVRLIESATGDFRDDLLAPLNGKQKNCDTK